MAKDRNGSHSFSKIWNFVVVFTFVASVLTSSAKGHVLEFSIEPSDTVVVEGSSAVLDCTVRSQHPTTVLIQWLDQDSQVITMDSYRSQLANGSLYINNVSEEGGLAGTYQCMAVLPNIGSIVSKSAKLSITRLSTFVEEPRDLTVFVGQKAHFQCRLAQTYLNHPTVRWIKDDRPFPLDELRMTLLPSGSLEIDDILESDQGAYRCNVSNMNDFKLSNKATLVVDSDPDKRVQISTPVFITKPHSEVAIEGQNVSLDCAAIGYPKPTIKWLKDGYIIDMNFLDSRFSLVGSTNSLRITNIKEDDSGTYQCRAENREDSLDASATVQVLVPPRFITKPVDVTEYENKDIELKCNVHGIPTPKIHWLKNGELIIPSDYYEIINGHNLRIKGLISQDTGLVQCFASNSAGNIQAAASVKVLKAEYKKKGKQKKAQQHKDETKIPLKTQSIALFSSLKSEKTARLGDVNFSHLLTSKNTNLDTKSKMVDPHSVLTALKSSETNLNDDTNSNVLGDIQSAYSSHHLASPHPLTGHHGKPQGDMIGPPQDVNAPVVKARFITLSWKPPLVNGEGVETYSVYYRQEGSERERSQNTSRSKLEEIMINELIPGRVYHFRVVAYNKNGPGTPSDVLTVTTQAEEHVPSAPMHFEAYATNSRAIHVSWRPPENPVGVIKKYKVYYMETRLSIEHNIETTDLEYDFTNLGIFSEYSIWVVAFNNNGEGAATEEKLVRTFSDAPTQPPFNVTVEPGSTSLTVRWEPPLLEHQNGIITGYKIRLKKLSARKASTITTPSTSKMYVFNDLEKETAYQIKLWAMNVNGTSPPTDWIQIDTVENILDESKVPDQPGPLIVRPAADKLYITWTPPKNQDIMVRNYILGWGKGIPDTFHHELTEKSRYYVLERLEPNSEYVLSLRASNEMGAGIPVYATVRTQEETPPTPAVPLIPPVGLKAHILSTTSVVLYWTDTTIGKSSSNARSNRHYLVKYSADKSLRHRILNVTDENVMIDDLKPNTLYEFTVKLVKGTNESPWSMVVTNTTWELPPNAAPTKLDVHLQDERNQLVELTWQPPKIINGRVTGYVILYTDNKTKSDREWLVHAIKGDRHASVVPDLRPFTEYYFKVQARNSRGYGPFSNVVMFRTGQNVGNVALAKESLDSKSFFTGNILLYIIIAGSTIAVVTVSVVSIFLCCRKREPRTTTTSPDRSKKGYEKTHQDIKPPDLWIHHDQMELKNMEKSHSNNDAGSSSGTTLPRSVGGNDYDTHDHIHSSSLDKRTYVPSYAAIATPINTNTALSQSSSDSIPPSRPFYPRTQYSLSRAHVTVDSNMGSQGVVESPYASHPSANSLGYDGVAPSSLPSQPPPVAHVPPGNAYAPGMSVLAESQGGKRIQGQSHPLKSFTVPAPPPISAPGTPQAKHMVGQPQVTVRANCSPFKRPPTSNSGSPSAHGPGPSPSRISGTHPPAATQEELQRLNPSHSTEELNQEMANLEGLMLTLNAITANEFEC